MIKQRKKIMIRGLCLLIAMILAIVGGILYRRDCDEKHYEAQFEYSSYYHDSVDIHQMFYDDESRIYGVVYKEEERGEDRRYFPIIVFDQCFINTNYHGTKKYYREKPNNTDTTMLVENSLDYLTFDLISFKTGKVEKTIDIKALLSDYLEDYVYVLHEVKDVQLDGRSYVPMILTKKPDQEDVWQEEEELILLFDVETEALTIATDEQMSEGSQGSEYKHLFDYCTWYVDSEFLELNGLIFEDDSSIDLTIREHTDRDIIEVIIEDPSFLQNNSKINQMLVNEKKQSDENGVSMAKFYIPTDGTLTTLDVLEYFVDQEVGIQFDQFTLSEEASVDGEKHVITSREEFEKYYNGYWEEHE